MNDRELLDLDRLTVSTLFNTVDIMDTIDPRLLDNTPYKAPQKTAVMRKKEIKMDILKYKEEKKKKEDASKKIENLIKKIQDNTSLNDEFKEFRIQILQRQLDKLNR